MSCSANGKGGFRGWVDIHSLKSLVALETSLPFNVIIELIIYD